MNKAQERFFVCYWWRTTFAQVVCSHSAMKLRLTRMDFKQCTFSPILTM